MINTPQATAQTLASIIDMVEAVEATENMVTTVLLSMAPVSESKVYVSILSYSENPYGFLNEHVETAHKSCTFPLSSDSDFAKVVANVRSRFSPQFQHNCGAGVRMSIVL